MCVHEKTFPNALAVDSDGNSEISEDEVLFRIVTDLSNVPFVSAELFVSTKVLYAGNTACSRGAIRRVTYFDFNGNHAFEDPELLAVDYVCN